MANIFQFTQPVELLFVNLFELRTPKGVPGAKPRWSITVNFPKTSSDYEAVKTLVIKTFRDKFPTVDLSGVEWPFVTGEAFTKRAISKAATDEKKAQIAKSNAHLAGHVVLSAKALADRGAPQLSVLVPGQGIVTYEGAMRETVRDKFYCGCQVIAEINFCAWKRDGSEERFDRYGVTAYVNAVLSLNTGERRGGQRSGAERFGAFKHEGVMSTVDPRPAISEDIPF